MLPVAGIDLLLSDCKCSRRGRSSFRSDVSTDSVGSSEISSSAPGMSRQLLESLLHKTTARQSRPIHRFARDQLGTAEIDPTPHLSERTVTAGLPGLPGLLLKQIQRHAEITKYKI